MYTTRYVDYEVVEYLKNRSEKEGKPVNWIVEDMLKNLTVEEAKNIKRTNHKAFGRLKLSPKNLETLNQILIEVNKDRQRTDFIYMNDVLKFLVEKAKKEEEQKKKEQKKKEGIFSWFA